MSRLLTVTASAVLALGLVAGTGAAAATGPFPAREAAKAAKKAPRPAKPARPAEPTPADQAGDGEQIAPADCAFRRQDPCLAPRTKSFTFWGPYVDVDVPGATALMTVRSFGLASGPLRRALAGEYGQDVEVSLVKATRTFVVSPDGKKTRESADTFLGVLDAYERATLYVSGVLKKRSYWNDDAPQLAASTITVDLSDLRDPLPHLEGSWGIDGDGRTVTLTADADDPHRFAAEVAAGGTVTERFTLTLKDSDTACVSDWAPASPDGRALAFGCGPVALSAKRIGGIGFSGTSAGSWSLSRRR